MATNSNPLTTAVEEALKDDSIVEQVENKETEEKTEEPEKTETKEDKSSENESEALSDEAKQGIALLKLLQDPKTAVDTMKFLQKQILGDETPSTKQQVKSVKQLISDELGEEYQFLADKLGTAFEKALNIHENNIIEKQVKPLKQELENAKAAQAAKEVDNAWNAISKETKGDLDKYEKEISRLMDRYKPDGQVTMEEYLRDLYEIASSKAKKAQSLKATNEKINKNANDKQSLSSGVNETRIKRGSTLPSLKEAVLAASRGEVFED